MAGNKILEVPMIIRGRRIILRAIERKDLPFLHQWANDPEIAQGLGDVHFPSSLLQQEYWFEQIQKNQNTVRLAIEHTEGECVLIGYSGYWNIHWKDRRAEHALLIGDSGYRKRGIGKEVILTSARYAFEELGFHRLDANVLETNEASLKCYMSCGFKIEGHLRGHAFRSGKWVTRIMLGLLIDEYLAGAKNSNY
jgi:RimJ/RimL family protein N-acetyltransferase